MYVCMCVWGGGFTKLVNCAQTYVLDLGVFPSYMQQIIFGSHNGSPTPSRHYNGHIKTNLNSINTRVGLPRPHDGKPSELREDRNSC